MPPIGPITDDYIDSIIKSNTVSNPDLTKTQGEGLRELVKLLRDRLEQEIAEAGTSGGKQISYNFYQSVL